jgi:hypothetical protein
MRVFKQVLKIDKTITQEIVGLTLLSAKIIDNEISVWFEEDSTNTIKNEITIVTSGQEFDNTGLGYFTTVFNDDGHLYHLYYKTV